MKFKDTEGNEFVFDELPKIFNPTQLVFFTHLHHLNAMYLQIPFKMPKIYTTKHLAEQLLSHYPLRFHLTHFHLLIPFEPLTIQLLNGKSLTVLACEEDEEMLSGKLMILIKKPDKQIYFYAGICTTFRRMLLSDSFANMLADGVVVELILHLIPSGYTAWTACEAHTIHTNAIIDNINKLGVDNKLRLIVPIFGFEPLIERILYCFRGRVAIDVSYNQLGKQLKESYLQPDEDKAFIQITNNESKENFAPKRHIIKIVNITEADKENQYKWSPYPTAFELIVLIKLLHPKHIINSCNMPTAATDYLGEYNELLKRHTETPRRLTLATTKTVNTTPSTVACNSTLCGQTVNSPSTISGNRLTIGPDEHTTAPFVRRKRHLDYTDSSSSE